MKENYTGYVVYNKSNGKNKPYAVVSETYESHALTTQVPKRAKKLVIPIEDRRFYKHIGIDVKSITRAIIRNMMSAKVVEGGSTITQQLARNLMRDNSRTPHRKLKEILKAIRLEKLYSKDQILDEYFNNVYFGKNLRGIRSASLYFFRKEPIRLTQLELLHLITLLRGPNYYLKYENKTLERFKLLTNILLSSKIISKSKHLQTSEKLPKFKITELSNVSSLVVKHITEFSSIKTKTIYSTLNADVQAHVVNVVKLSRYPLSIIAIKNQTVIGFASAYGSDYVFTNKTNVGSTLKPFLYCYARQSGVDKDHLFDAHSNSLNWNVREVADYGAQLSLGHALIKSNNNTFVNVADHLGIENVLDFLSKTLNISSNSLSPASVLGATKSGISIYELALSFEKYFTTDVNLYKRECLNILNQIFRLRTKSNICNVVLKTGTTNDNKERLAIARAADVTFAILRNENPIDDYTKDGNFMETLIDLVKPFTDLNKEYLWR